MTQYVDKDALVEEITNLKKRYDCGWNCAIDKVFEHIDELKAKEMDPEHLEREVEDFCNKFDDRKDKWYDMTPHDKNIVTNPTWRNFAIQLAKHFFELGLETQKGEQV